MEVGSARPTSSRPQSRINPITGEEMPYSARGAPKQQNAYGNHGTQHTGLLQAEGRKVNAQTRPSSATKTKTSFLAQSRPDSVPKLSLGKLANEDHDLDITLNIDPYSYKLDTPSGATSISWGTPSSVQAMRKLQDLQHYSDLTDQHVNQGKQALHRPQSGRPQAGRQQPSEPSAWDKDPVPENLPGPPRQYQQQYDQLQQEMRDSYRTYSNKTVSNADIEQKIEELRLDIPVFDPQDEDDLKDKLQKDWTTQPYTKAAQIRRQDKDSLEEINRKKKLIETVMIDQLSRPVISRPESNMSSRLAAQRAARGTVRTLHDSKVCAGTATENLLSKRVQFGARILTRNGRDALRELSGFYFAVDNSLTVYEFKQFGKTAKALPFIQRNVYSHLSGPRKDKPYDLTDIKQGCSLVFDTGNQPLPDSVKARETIILKITDTDDSAKADILFNGVSPPQQDEVWKRAHIPQTKEEINAKLLFIQVQECVRSQIRKRGIKVFTGLGAHYHKLDEGDGMLNKVELDKSLIEFHIDVPQDHFDDLWDVLDPESTGFMAYEVFMRAFLGEMSERRKVYVCKAFRKIDGTKQGQVTFDDIKKFYNAQNHPRVRSRECTESEILENFLCHFSKTVTKGVITFFEFENYYEGLSVCIEADDDFNKILQNAWSI